MLQILVLGGTEVRDADGTLIPLRGAKQRILLVLLALAEGRPVPLPVLVEGLWGEQPPGDPEHALQAHVSRLRTMLGLEIALTPTGYRLDPSQVDLDAARFDRECARARRLLGSGDPSDVPLAGRALRTALGRWRGPAFADLRDVAPLRPAAARLDEQWHTALADRIDLESGTGAPPVGELHELVAEHPLRERYWAQLVRALHLEGRAGEALEIHARARRLLA